MAVGDIYRIFVSYQNGEGGKERYTVEIGRNQENLVILDSITSQYQQKSECIKTQYYPIKDWLQAGLKKPSYVDIKSSQLYELQSLMQHGKYTGRLSMRDVEDLAQFIKSYRLRLQQLKNR